MGLLRKSGQNFEPPSRFELLLQRPLQYAISILYRVSTRMRALPAPRKPTVRIVCLSDTHTLRQHDVPTGDVLIHAGDMTNKGDLVELQETIDWIASQPHRYKVVIAGNHDTHLDPRSRQTLSEKDRAGQLHWQGIHYLRHSSITLAFGDSARGRRRLTIYGAPQIPACGGDDFAFQYQRGEDAWSDTIPAETDVLVTHTPPAYHRDLMNPHMGCEHLLSEVWRVKPKLHVFGHVHAAAGREAVWWDESQRHYESAMSGTSKGFLRQLLDVWLWITLFKLLVSCATAVVWNRVWGGEARSTVTVMVNAALMYNNTGRLGNPVQVVDV